MANPNVPRGLVPVRTFGGGYFNGFGNIYYMPASDTNNIFIGDPVIVSGVSDANGVPGITLATAGTGNFITGSFQGFIPGGGPILPELAILRDSTIYRQAGVAGYCLVTDDSNQMYEVQEDSIGGALTANAASDNANLVAGAGNTVFGYSGWQLQSSSVATTATLQVRILRGIQRVDNTIGANFKWYVKLVLSATNNATGV